MFLRLSILTSGVMQLYTKRNTIYGRVIYQNGVAMGKVMDKNVAESKAVRHPSKAMCWVFVWIQFEALLNLCLKLSRYILAHPFQQTC
jgi:hypothetical protein